MKLYFYGLNSDGISVTEVEVIEKPKKSGVTGLPYDAAIEHESDESPAFDADSIGILVCRRQVIPRIKIDRNVCRECESKPDRI